MTFQTINPTNNQVVKSFDDWKQTDYQTRSKILCTVAGLLRAKRKDLAKMITLEMGKLFAYAEGEIKLSAEIFINHPIWTQADLPFGGTKGSGYGREMAQLGLDEFANKKLIS